MIQNGAGQSVMLNEKHGMPERVGRCDMGSPSFERHGDIHGDQGLIFHDEKTEAAQNRMVHKVLHWRG